MKNMFKYKSDHSCCQPSTTFVTPQVLSAKCNSWNQGCLSGKPWKCQGIWHLSGKCQGFC